MKFFFWFCLVLLIPGMLIRIPFGGAGILATDIVVPIFALTWIFFKIVKQESFPTNSFVLPGTLFGIIAFLTFLWGAWSLSFSEIALSFSYLIRFFSLLIFGWAAQDLFAEKNLTFSLKNREERTLPSHASQKRKELKSSLSIKQTNRGRSFFKPFFWIFFFVVFFGFLQFYLVPSIADFSTEGGLDPHEGRMLGTWLDPNFFAGILGFVIPLLCSKFYEAQQKRVKIVYGIFVSIFLIALFLTFSRSGYVASLAGILLFFVFQDWRIILLGILIVGIGLATNQRAQQRVEELTGTVSAIVFQDTDEIDPTASLRVESWMKSFELWQKYPVLGIGYNTYRTRASEEGIVNADYFSAGGSDSTLLTILVTTGVFGFASFLYFLGKLFWVNFQKFRKNHSVLFLGFCSGLLSIFVHALFVNSLLFPFVFLPIMAVAGVLENEK